MDILRLYTDFNIPHVTEGHKHARDGWVNIECPFCTGNPGFHLGWNLYDEYFFCWRCGWKPTLSTLEKVLDVSKNYLPEILKGYGINRTQIKKVKGTKKEFKLPSGVTELWKPHLKYLIERGFSPHKLKNEWWLKGTGPVSKLDGIDYRYRVIIPFMWNGEMVSFDSRDTTNKQTNKYQACPKNREILEHKKILYGDQEYWESTGIVVEGPADVWRLGKQACAVSGIKYTPAQVRILAQTFKKICVIFDGELQAQKQAKNLVSELRFRGIDAQVKKIKGDPGGLKQHEADELVKSILKTKIIKI